MNLNDFHFLSPLWFLAIPIVLLLFFKKIIPVFKKNNLAAFCDKHLIAYLTSNSPYQYKKTTFFNQQSLSKWGLMVSALLIILALASPVWQKLPTDIYQGGYKSIVIVLDLSSSMNANDIKPTRLQRAKFKIKDILKIAQQRQIKKGQITDKKQDFLEIGVVAYTAQAFVISPITSDTNNLDALVNALDSDLMPTYGSNLASGIQKANELLNQAKVHSGNILVVSDDVQGADFNELEQIATKHQISLLAMTSEQGAVIPSIKGGLLKDSQGRIYYSKPNLSKMKDFVNIGKGIYQLVRFDDADIKNLLAAMRSDQNFEILDLEQKADRYQQEYFWLLIVVMAILLTYFRKGAFVILALPIFSLPNYQVKADQIDADSSMQNIFYSDDFNGQENFSVQDYEKAAKQFQDLRWKASSLYKKGDYQKALDLWKNFNQVDDFYNQGNAYAQLKDYQKAIESYDKALAIDPNHQKTLENKKRILDFLEKQSSKNNQSNQQNQDGGEGKTDSSNNNNQGQGKDQTQTDSSSNNEQNNTQNKQQSSANNAQNKQDKNDQSQKDQNNKQNSNQNNQSNQQNNSNQQNQDGGEGKTDSSNNNNQGQGKDQTQTDSSSNNEQNNTQNKQQSSANNAQNKQDKNDQSQKDQNNKQNSNQNNQSNQQNNSNQQNQDGGEGKTDSSNNNNQGQGKDQAQTDSSSNNEQKQNNTQNKQQSSANNAQNKQDKNDYPQNNQPNSQQNNIQTNNQNEQFDPDPNSIDDQVGNRQIEQDGSSDNNPKQNNQATKAFKVDENTENSEKQANNTAIMQKPIDPKDLEKKIYIRQQLQKVKDDPAELMRRKFLYQYRSGTISPDNFEKP